MEGEKTFGVRVQKFFISWCGIDNHATGLHLGKRVRYNIYEDHFI